MIATAKLLLMPSALDTHEQARDILPFGFIKYTSLPRQNKYLLGQEIFKIPM